MGVSGYAKIGKRHVCTFLSLSFSNSIILWELDVIFTPKLDVCKGNAYVKFELNPVYMVLSALLLGRNVWVRQNACKAPFYQIVQFLHFCKRSCLKPWELAHFLYTTLKNMFLYACVQCFNLLGLKGNFLQIFKNIFMSAKPHKIVERFSTFIYEGISLLPKYVSQLSLLFITMYFFRSKERHLVKFHSLQNAPRLQSQ